MANNQAPEEFEIVKVDNGSLIIDLQLTLETVKLIAETMNSLTELAINLTAMYTALETTKTLKKLVTPATYASLKDEAEESIENEKDSIIEKIVNNLKNKKLFTRNDAVNELTSSIKELIKFNEEGGSLECLTSNRDDKENIKITDKLNNSFITYQNKSEIKLINHKSNKETETETEK